MSKYKRVNGHVIRCADDDPEGRERWEINGKWSEKPGRKPGDDLPRQPVSLRLPQDVIDWLRTQPDGATGTIEKLCRNKMAG